jgi:hypothetical protein
MVAASASRGIRSVGFLVDGHLVARGRKGSDGIWSGTWTSGRRSQGRHVLAAVVRDRRGHTASAHLPVRVCR